MSAADHDAVARELGDAMVAKCLRALDAARAVHPELRKALTWNGALGICRRLGIRIIHARMPRPARVIAPLGTPIVILNPDVPPRRHTYFLAHEIAHVLLHIDPSETAVYNMDACWEDDPREEEAELLATLMMQGPRFPRPL